MEKKSRLLFLCCLMAMFLCGCHDSEEGSGEDIIKYQIEKSEYELWHFSDLEYDKSYIIEDEATFKSLCKNEPVPDNINWKRYSLCVVRGEARCGIENLSYDVSKSNDSVVIDVSVKLGSLLAPEPWYVAFLMKKPHVSADKIHVNIKYVE